MDAGALLSSDGSRACTTWKWHTANVGALLARAAPPASAKGQLSELAELPPWTPA